MTMLGFTIINTTMGVTMGKIQQTWLNQGIKH
jgi:hypothetical protein